MTVPITAFEEIEPDELHLVGKGANGFPALLQKAVAEAVKDVTDEDCPTCGGTGKAIRRPDQIGVRNDQTVAAEDRTEGADEDYVTCMDCDGTGQRNIVAAETGSVKSELSADDRKNLHNSSFADPENEKLPVHDADHVKAALGRFNQTQFDSDKAKRKAAKKIMSAAKKFGVEVSDDSNVAQAAKSSVLVNGTVVSQEQIAEVLKDIPMVTGANPGIMVPSSDPVTDMDDANTPGSATWEAVDAAMAAEAASSLSHAAQLIQNFIDREQAEVQAGDDDDANDVFDAQQALDSVSYALGVIARLSFTEGAGKAAKAGRVLSGKNIAGLKAALKAIQDVLATAGEDATKGIENMTPDELATLLDERDAARREAKKAAKAEKKAAKGKTEKTETSDAAKAEEHQEEVQETPAEAAAKAATEEIKEVVREVTERLATVEKMAQPGGPVKTRTQADLSKSAERDALDIEVARYEQLAKDMAADPDVRQGYQEKAAAARVKLAAL